MKNTLPKVLLISNLFVLDIVGGFLVYERFFAPRGEVASNLSAPSETASVNVEDGCGQKCIEYIDQKISNQVVITPTVTSAPKATVAAPKEKSKSVSYVPIPGAGSTLETDWVLLPGTDFYLSKADFQGLTEVYFEANVDLVNGNGKAYVRLFDVTHGIAVNGSELITSSQISTFLSSGKISLWDGFNHYQVQAKSLTADTTEYASGRLKMISEN